MMTFWIIAGGMTLLALLFVLPSLLGKGKGIVEIDRDGVNARIAREKLAQLEAEFEGGALDEDAYTQARDEIERSLLDDVVGGGEARIPPQGRSALAHWSPLVVGVLVPALAVWTYMQLGAPHAVERGAAPVPPVAAEAAEGNPHAAGQAGEMPPIADLANKLAQRLEAEPDNLEGWTMLGRTYDVLEQYADAARAYQHAEALAPNDPDLKVNLAEAIAMADNGNLQGRPRELIDAARQLDPQHGKALWYAGMARYQTGSEFREAVDFWMQLLVQMDESTEAYGQIAEIIRDAAERGGFEAPLAARVDALPGIQAPPPMAQAQPDAAAPDSDPNPASPAAAGGAAIKVSVSLGADLADKVAPGDTLFVYARALEGPRMPLAIVRVSAADLPFVAELNDAQAMMPAMRLSNFPQVVVGARVSKSGQAIAQPGDVYGEVSPVDTAGGSAVEIVMDQVK